MISLNNKGEKVIATNKFFYSLLNGNESFVCCGEYQDVQYCFKSDIRQGCVFCEYDPYSPCECAVCEK